MNIDINITKLGELAIDVVKQFAAKLGITIEQVFPYFVKQVYAESLSYLIGFGLIGITLILLGTFFFRRGKMRRAAELAAERVKAEEKGYSSRPGSDDEFYQGMAVGQVLTTVAGVIFIVVAVIVNVPGIINPEYEAVLI